MHPLKTCPTCKNIYFNTADDNQKFCLGCGYFFINPPALVDNIRIDIKPLSVNEAWQGKRFKTDAYKKFERDLLLLLPAKINLPNSEHYKIYFRFGFSSSLSDWDNPIKPTQDVLQKKYQFNDKQIKRAVVDVESVEKGNEYIEFQISEL